MNQLSSNQNNEKLEKPSILDTVSLSQQSAALRAFNPQSLVIEFLEKLPPREKQILLSRYGLQDGNPLTLETIGKKMNLTRERVRQIEKDAIRRLAAMPQPSNFANGVELVFQIIEENGKAMRQDRIFETVLLSQNTETNRMGILFMLQLVPKFHPMKETSDCYTAWNLSSFDRQIFDQTVERAQEILQKSGSPLDQNKFFSILSETGVPAGAVESYLTISKKISKNPFEQWGLAPWTEISPKDVGDKAFLVLKNLGKPEHYAKLTEIINKSKFDDRVAQKETVHNELIKDKRFVLVGRGIYALTEWGYKSGVVADVIEGVLRESATPLTKNEIIEKVSRQRLVKRNTIIVGLSNKNRFIKTAENKFTLAPSPKDA
ncbi:MAG: sigma factor-like helix-turn-helix DNA-binding protein [bacterium]|nr:sigma factor-like helix-turn-helix DNA-binding protein [bacterium]